MGLAVAGLKEQEIKARASQLASGDWSGFPAHERLAFEFAHKLSKSPAAVHARDVRALVQTFGPERALDLIWYTSWCNYMTRFADAFQLPLERENVFAPPPKEEKTKPDKPGKP